MNENEMVERVARAIAGRFGPAIDFRAPYAKVMLDQAARAAIAAMREPTEVMVDAGFRGMKDWRLGPSDPDEVWREMIDAALQPPEPENPSGQ